MREQCQALLQGARPCGRRGGPGGSTGLRWLLAGEGRALSSPVNRHLKGSRNCSPIRVKIWEERALGAEPRSCSLQKNRLPHSSSKKKTHRASNPGLWPLCDPPPPPQRRSFAEKTARVKHPAPLPAAPAAPGPQPRRGTARRAVRAAGTARPRGGAAVRPFSPGREGPDRPYANSSRRRRRRGRGGRGDKLLRGAALRSGGRSGCLSPPPPLLRHTLPAAPL